MRLANQSVFIDTNRVSKITCGGAQRSKHWGTKVSAVHVFTSHSRQPLSTESKVLEVNWVLTSADHFCGCPSKERRVSLSVAQQDLMIAEERWQLVRRCLQLRQLWTPWDSQDESILHFYSQEKGEDNCSVLVAASNCFERWWKVIKPGVTNHLDSDKSLESDSEHVVFLLPVYDITTPTWPPFVLCFSFPVIMSWFSAQMRLFSDFYLIHYNILGARHLLLLFDFRNERVTRWKTKKKKKALCSEWKVKTLLKNKQRMCTTIHQLCRS